MYLCNNGGSINVCLLLSSSITDEQMKIIRRGSAELIDVEIVEVNLSDFYSIRTSNEFIFDWYAETAREKYKLCLRHDHDYILGLIGLSDYPGEFRLHINLLEVSKLNVGKSKEIDNIAGCLIAFACTLSFKKGYGGFVSLKPKTVLSFLYHEKYGFRPFGNLLAVELSTSKNLIDKYIGDE